VASPSRRRALLGAAAIAGIAAVAALPVSRIFASAGARIGGVAQSARHLAQRASLPPVDPVLDALPGITPRVTPSEDHYTFSVATTRKVYHYDVTREGEERIAWPQGEVDTVRWHRKSEDSKTEAWFWLAPSLHYIPVKIRVTQTARGTLEVMLDAIRTDASPPAETDTAEPPLPSTVERVNPFAEHGQ
jgi:hypothetical protein